MTLEQPENGRPPASFAARQTLLMEVARRMGWFDWYLPAENFNCPVCDRPLVEWQGSDGPSALLIWKQFSALPIDQKVDADLRPSPWPNPDWKLPETFVIRSNDCGCPFPVEAIGTAVAQVWERTDLVTIANARQHGQETRAQWARRRRWLAGRT